MLTVAISDLDPSASGLPAMRDDPASKAEVIKEMLWQMRFKPVRSSDIKRIRARPYRSVNERSTKIVLRQESDSRYFNYLNIVTGMLAVQVIGAVQNASQLDYLCNSFSLDNLQALGLNSTTLHSALCDTPLSDRDFPISHSSLKDAMQIYADDMWVQQAFLAMQGNLTTLCNIFNPLQASNVGMNGTSVKEALCVGTGDRPNTNTTCKVGTRTGSVPPSSKRLHGS